MSVCAASNVMLSLMSCASRNFKDHIQTLPFLTAKVNFKYKKNLNAVPTSAAQAILSFSRLIIHIKPCLFGVGLCWGVWEVAS